MLQQQVCIYIKILIAVYDNGDGIPDAEAALRYVAKSIALYTLAVSDTTSETAVTTYYVDQGTFELETTCECFTLFTPAAP